MTTRQAWLKIRMAFERYSPIHPKDLNHLGICYALRILRGSNRITQKQLEQMTGDLYFGKSRAPRDGYFYDLDKTGASQRVKLINRILDRRKKHARKT